jgi:hypothetical protein
VDTRIQLAACYDLVPRYRMTDHIYTRISARDPGATDQFLLSPYGLKIGLEGRKVEGSAHWVNGIPSVSKWNFGSKEHAKEVG